PIEPPPAEEILPTVDSDPVTAQNPWDWDANAEPTAPSADPVRDLGASAISTASLQAAGAPTPASGIPLPDVDDVPDFGADEPFVPRFEPPLGAGGTAGAAGAAAAASAAAGAAAGIPAPESTPTPTPSVSFQPPAP